jgi:hypothetical protein
MRPVSPDRGRKAVWSVDIREIVAEAVQRRTTRLVRSGVGRLYVVPGAGDFCGEAESLGGGATWRAQSRADIPRFPGSDAHGDGQDAQSPS